MQVHFDEAAPHLLVLVAESHADLKTIGKLHSRGPLQAAHMITKPEGLGQRLTGLIWDTRGCPTVGAAVSPADVLRREAAHKLAAGLGELFCLALRQVQGDSVTQADATAPHPQEQGAAFFEQLKFVEQAFGANTRSGDRRGDEVQSAHEVVSRLMAGG